MKPVNTSFAVKFCSALKPNPIATAPNRKANAVMGILKKSEVVTAKTKKAMT
jgi:hypothetical protein